MSNSGLTVLTIIIINISYAEKTFGSRIFLLYDINDTSVIFFSEKVFSKRQYGALAMMTTMARKKVT